MAFTGKEGETISLDEAKKLTGDYQKNHPGAVKAVFMGAEIIQKILDQQGCMGIRVYFGEDNNQYTVVLVGANSNEDDMTEGVLADRGKPCPPDCPVQSPLMR